MKNKLGFTLLELLVVVVIIGILAAIALPQYQMAVGKAKFSTLKNLTKSVAEAAQRYYLVHNTYEGVNGNLDIEIPANINCHVWELEGSDQVQCQKEIFGTNINRYYVFRSTGKPKHCFAYTTDQTDNANRLCQKETNKPANPKYCNENYCSYPYN